MQCTFEDMARLTGASLRDVKAAWNGTKLVGVRNPEGRAPVKWCWMVVEYKGIKIEQPEMIKSSGEGKRYISHQGSAYRRGSTKTIAAVEFLEKLQKAKSYMRNMRTGGSADE